MWKTGYRKLIEVFNRWMAFGTLITMCPPVGRPFEFAITSMGLSWWRGEPICWFRRLIGSGIVGLGYPRLGIIVAESDRWDDWLWTQIKALYIPLFRKLRSVRYRIGGFMAMIPAIAMAKTLPGYLAIPYIFGMAAAIGSIASAPECLVATGMGLFSNYQWDIVLSIWSGVAVSMILRAPEDYTPHLIESYYPVTPESKKKSIPMLNTPIIESYYPGR